MVQKEIIKKVGKEKEALIEPQIDRDLEKEFEDDVTIVRAKRI